MYFYTIEANEYNILRNILICKFSIFFFFQKSLSKRHPGGECPLDMCHMSKNRIVPKITDGRLQDYRFLWMNVEHNETTICPQDVLWTRTKHP